ncbi:MAG: hypothetical protein E5W00_25050, partial [Mesorhizobium sp.]
QSLARTATAGAGALIVAVAFFMQLLDSTIIAYGVCPVSVTKKNYLRSRALATSVRTKNQTFDVKEQRETPRYTGRYTFSAVLQR